MCLNLKVSREMQMCVHSLDMFLKQGLLKILLLHPYTSDAEECVSVMRHNGNWHIARELDFPVDRRDGVELEIRMYDIML